MSDGLGKRGAIERPLDDGDGKSLYFLLLGSHSIEGSGRPRFLAFGETVLQVAVGEVEPLVILDAQESVVCPALEETASFAEFAGVLLAVACSLVCSCMVCSLTSAPALDS